jgi:hypothetical protein
MFEHNHFTGKGLFVYLSSFLEIAMPPLAAGSGRLREQNKSHQLYQH